MSAPAKQPPLLGEVSAEFFGTMILILFGVGVVAQVNFTYFQSEAPVLKLVITPTCTYTSETGV